MTEAKGKDSEVYEEADEIKGEFDAGKSGELRIPSGRFADEIAAVGARKGFAVVVGGFGFEQHNIGSRAIHFVFEGGEVDVGLKGEANGKGDSAKCSNK